MLFFLAGLLACADKDAGETGPTWSCEGGGELSLSMGYGLAGEFTPYTEGEVVGMTSAPQGGFGVPVRILMTGLRVAEGEQPYADMDVLLETYLDGALSASFLNEDAVGYCQDDGRGLAWDLVVGFDEVEYNNVDSLISLHGRTAELLVEASDLDGRSAAATLNVELSVE